jgi:hypothetical protein
VSPFGTVVIAGQTQGTLTFPGSTTTLSPTSAMGDGFVVQLDESLTFTWGRTLGVNSEVVGVGLDMNQDVRAVGWFTGTLDIGAAKIDAGTNQMMLLADLAGTTGAVTWNQGWLLPNGGNNGIVAHLAVAPAGDSFIAGTLSAGPVNLGTGMLFQPTDSSEVWAGRFGP